MNSDEVNPYAAPQTAEVIPAEEVSVADAIRLQHLGYESVVRSIGALYVLAGLFWVLVFIIAILAIIDTASNAGAMELVVMMLAMGMITSICVSLLAVGRGLILLRRWTLIPACLLAAFMLLMFPIGTVLGIICLSVLLLPKSRFVLSHNYQAIIQQTPHMRARTAIVIYIIAALAILIFVMGIMGVFFV